MKKLLIIVIAIAVCVCGARIYSLNKSSYLKYLPDKIIYEKGDKAPLNSGEYYFGSYDLDGYFVKVLNYQILPVKEFLKSHNQTESFLTNNNLSVKSDYICIVSAEFNFEKKESSPDKAINLAEFKLVGTDYYINSSTEFNKLESFNPRLKGNSVFAITSGKPFTVDLAYLIPSDYENGISLEYFNNSDPKLLVTYYPDENYLKIK